MWWRRHGLKNIVDELYGRESVKDKDLTGDGRTATALIEEYNSGKPVGAKWHVEKASNKLAGLAALMEKDRKARMNGGNGLLSDADLEVATNESRHLWNALTAHDVTGAVTAHVQSNPATLKAVANNRRAVVRTEAMSDITGQAFERHHPKAPPRIAGEAKNLRGGYKAFGLAGGLGTAAQAPSYVREYGWGGGAWELTKDMIDPFGAHELLEPLPQEYA